MAKMCDPSFCQNAHIPHCYHVPTVTRGVRATKKDTEEVNHDGSVSVALREPL